MTGGLWDGGTMKKETAGQPDRQTAGFREMVCPRGISLKVELVVDLKC